MNTLNLNELLNYLNACHFKPLAILQHGSTSMGVASDFSDIDLLILINCETKYEKSEYAFIDSNKNKIHMKIMSIEQFSIMLNNFQKEISQKILDLNLLSGRVLMCKVIYSTIDVTKILDNAKQKIDFDKISTKFLYQFYSYLNDAKHPNDFIKQNCIEKSIDSLVTSILLKHKITTLNTKWHPLLIKEILSPETYNDYLNLRFNYNALNSIEINSKIKNLVSYRKDIEK